MERIWKRDVKRKVVAKVLIGCLSAAVFATTSVVTKASVQAAVADDYFPVTDNISLDMQGKVKSNTQANLSMNSTQPIVDNFIDYQGHLNLAYLYNNKVYIKRLDCHYQEIDEIELAFAMEVFGAVTCDDKGNYYVVSAISGASMEENPTSKIMAITKYDYNGVNILEHYYSTEYTNSDIYFGGNYFCTKVPFDWGSCDVAINSKGVLACNYARMMFSEHQSNFIFYVNTETLNRIKRGSVPYTSHSFNQRIIALSNNTFLSMDQGDGAPRSFHAGISGNVSGEYKKIAEYEVFHFREGTNRDHGYNRTFAQMGSAVAIDGGAAFCATSERTLSLEAASANHNEARDVFAQIYQFRDNSKKCYLMGGVAREAEGSHTGNELTETFLKGDEKDQGVIWLTDYDDDYFAANSRMVNVGNYLIVLWNKLKYKSNSYDVYKSEGTYYAVLKTDGTIVKEQTRLGDVPLPKNADVITDGSSIFFAETDGTDKMTLHILPIHIAELGDDKGTVTGHKFQKTVVKATATEDGLIRQHCIECNKNIRETKIPHISKIMISKCLYNGSEQEPEVTLVDADGAVIESKWYSLQYLDNKNVGEATVIVTLEGEKYEGTLRQPFVIRPQGTSIRKATMNSNSVKVDFYKQTEQTTGYKVRCRLKGESKWTVKTVSNNKTTHATFKKLKAGKKYEFQVRTYKKLDGKNYYSDWSKMWTVKTMK